MAAECQDNANTRLLYFFSKPQIVIIAVVCFLLSAGLLGLGLWRSQYFEGPTERVLYCVATAFFLSLFLFILYPQHVRLKKIPIIGWPVEIVGPPALFVIVLALLLEILPEQAKGRLCLAEYPPSSRTRPWRTIGIEPTDLSYDILISPEGKFRGIYVWFKDRDKYEVSVFWKEDTTRQAEKLNVERKFIPLPFKMPAEDK